MPETTRASIPPGSIAVILPAAGSGQRFGAERNKLFAPLAGKPLWHHSAERLASRSEVGRLIVSVSQADHDHFLQQCDELRLRVPVELCRGGAQRSDSVASALNAIGGDDSIGYVAVHDAARPLVRDNDLTAVFDMAAKIGAAILAAPVAGTVKRARPVTSNETLSGCETVDRRELFIALTPQVFRIDLLRSAYARHRGFPVTDDAQLVERMGHPVVLVPGSADNLKITYPEDLAIAEALLKRHV